MGGRWRTQSDRWRLAMRQSADGSDADRLAGAIAVEIREGTLPAGALLPTAARLAVDLMLDESEVRSAYEQLERAGLLRSHSDQRVCVAGTPRSEGGRVGQGATILAFGRARRPGENTGEKD